MDLNETIWNEINSTPRIGAETKKSLHVRIMRAVELAKAAPTKKLGVTVVTEESSLAADRVAQDRRRKPEKGDPKPKSF